MDNRTFPTLITERLRLRELCEDDIPKIVEYANNPKIAEMTLNIPYPYQEKDAKWWIDVAKKGFANSDHFIFAICPKSTNTFIGGIGLEIDKPPKSAELGFWIGEPFWNQGYMTEAVLKVLSFGFEERDLNEIRATHFINNPASGRVMQKCGMTKEGEFKEHVKKGDEYKSVVKYSLTYEQFNMRDTNR